MPAELSLPAITLWQPWASLVACGAKTWETRGHRTRYRGRIAIHAGTRVPPDGESVGGWLVYVQADAVRALDRSGAWHPLPLGAIVATAELTDCCPIGGPYSFRTGHVDGDEGDFPGQAVVVRHEALGTLPASLVVSEADTTTTDISDQLPFGWWDRVPWAWRLDDIKPTTERCPWCWGAGGFGDGSADQCWACLDVGTCGPVPARGMPGIWKWRP
jgi:hypothetical protein